MVISYRLVSSEPIKSVFLTMVNRSRLGTGPRTALSVYRVLKLRRMRTFEFDSRHVIPGETPLPNVEL